ncbi:MAG: helicase associated domain-containing protein [bacterium]
MAKIVVRTKGRVHVIERETKQERRDRLWLEMYGLLVEFMNKFGHQKFPTKPKLADYGIKYKSLRTWANHQRTYSNSGELEDWQYSMLVKAGLDFNPRETLWNKMYDELLEFKRINGHCNVSRYDEEYEQLGNWVFTQRHTRESKSPIRTKKLDEIGFDWGVKRNKWDEMYERLRNYYKEHGTSLVKIDLTKKYMEDKDRWLRRWANKQILHYKSGSLTLDKIRMLEKLDFDFEPKKTYHKNQWERQFVKLLPYKNIYGDYNVPIDWEDDPVFGNWVERQRSEKNNLSEWKIARLDEIGFNWSAYDAIWERNYNALKQYYEKYGHLRVHPTQDKKLHNLVNYMRNIKRGYRGQSLSENQIKQLEEIGFEWEPSIQYWYRMYRLLIEFKSQNGNCNVELNNDTEILYKWCESNRKNKSNLSVNQIQNLNKIGFDWEIDK